jgi:hypothetical protein
MFPVFVLLRPRSMAHQPLRTYDDRDDAVTDLLCELYAEGVHAVRVEVSPEKVQGRHGLLVHVPASDVVTAEFDALARVVSAARTCQIDLGGDVKVKAERKPVRVSDLRDDF